MSKKELAKVYEPAPVEKRWSAKWLELELFTPTPDSTKPAFSMVIPPPNITGSLHLGHALNNTLQDIMARYKRMCGFNVLWLPGIDHAGIATQNVVERQLHAEGLDRNSLGREGFIDRVWKWKDESGGVIIEQLKRLGSSCDWTRLRFTMDPGLTRAVREVFVKLYQDGLIYRGDYIINWCPRCHTALSDLEVEFNETEGRLYYLSYPVKGDASRVVTVATTRPETMLGDTAVAVNPEDERYKDLVGKTLTLPLTDRVVPVIADAAVDMEFGTGALKITPAHDFSDFETAAKHGLDTLNVMDEDARMNEDAGAYKGLDRYEARERIVADLKRLGLLERTEPYKVMLGSCYRCRTAVEPRLSRQWFVKVKPLAEAAIKAVEDGSMRFVPTNWEKTYFDWMRKIRDWCISRQIWWGHRIPAWHCASCGQITVSVEDPVECAGCKSKEIDQDSDVLDTWFSSALWPFSTLGWPDKTAELKTFYPTTTLFTSFDIIFFWVARMMMMGLKFMGEVPFREVYIHALIRDAKGQKMSKSKGNVIDPLVMMDKYGTDSLRFTLAALAAHGRDIKLNEKTIEGYRNFSNKLWNLARFALMNTDAETTDVTELTEVDPDALTLPDKWILTRLENCRAKVAKALDRYEFDDAAKALYGFVWHELCDWYVELIKPDLRGESGPERKAVCTSVLLNTLADTVALLHPFMPFITEEINSYLPGRTRCIMEQGFSETRRTWDDEAGRMETAMGITRAVRNIRSEMRLPRSKALDCICFVSDGAKSDAISSLEPYIKELAGLEGFTVNRGGKRPRECAFAVSDGVEVFVPLKGLIDFDAESTRLGREILKVTSEIASVEKKLANESFLKKAPAAVVEKQRTKLVGFADEKTKLEAGLTRLKQISGE